MSKHTIEIRTLTFRELEGVALHPQRIKTGQPESIFLIASHIEAVALDPKDVNQLRIMMSSGFIWTHLLLADETLESFTSYLDDKLSLSRTTSVTMEPPTITSYGDPQRIAQSVMESLEQSMVADLTREQWNELGLSGIHSRDSKEKQESVSWLVVQTLIREEVLTIFTRPRWHYVSCDESCHPLFDQTLAKLHQSGVHALHISTEDPPLGEHPPKVLEELLDVLIFEDGHIICFDEKDTEDVTLMLKSIPTLEFVMSGKVS